MFDYTRMLDKRMIDEGIIAFTGPQWTSHIQLVSVLHSNRRPEIY